MTTTVLVVHCKKAPYEVYIGRPGPWGNPFVIGKDGNRTQVIWQYLRWVVTQDDLMQHVGTLRNTVLGCWCAPLMCHGHILAALANDDTGTLRTSEQRLIQAARHLWIDT